MKTKINNLLGAVLSLLVTFGLTQNPAALARILIIGLASLVAAPGASAQSTGGGLIYYIGPWAGATTAGTAVMTTMNSDGSNKTRLGLGMFGHPSTALHNSHRWFIYTKPITGQFYPDGIQRSEVIAFRDDYDDTLNNNFTTRVQLTDDITLQPLVGSTDWVPGDQQISFKARRWSSAVPGAIVVEGGLYTASLVFDGDGNITGLAAPPTTPAIPFPLVESPPGTPGGLWPGLADYCWAPAGDRVAYANYAQNELWVADLLNAHTRIYIGQVLAPQWSPDDAKIAFYTGRGISTIKPNGTGVISQYRSKRT